MHNPRYWQQWNRDHLIRTLNTGDVGLSSSGLLATAGASHGDWSVNLGNGANAGAGVYPAKYFFQITSANCAIPGPPDYVVFSTGLQGAAGQASIVAFDNLYSGCTGIVPTVYWAFNTGGQVLTSPAISQDGKQVAFVQTDGTLRGTLVLLKWAAGGTVSAPVTLAAVSNAAYRGCTAPCMTTIILRDGGGTATNDITSSVFPDYSHDTIWVGGALGWLHKITGVFRGTPTQVTTGGFPVQVRNTTFTSSPVYDFASNNVFIGDASGFFYRVSNTSPPVVTASAQIDFGAGIVAGPIVDGTTNRVYVFASSDGSSSCGGQPCTAVYQFGTGFAAGATGNKAVVGASVAFPSSPSPLFAGGFDSKYFTSGNATGNLYVCGNTGGAPRLYQIPINAGTMAAPVAGPILTSATTGCSPVTDISNPNATGGTTEWIFAGVQGSGLGNLCASGGCAMNFVNTPWLPSHAYAVGQQVLASNFQIQTCRRAGTSAALGPPTWNTTVGGSTTDAGTLRWVNQGPQAAAHGTWLPSHAYVLANSIIDSNGNIQVVTNGGTSKTGAHPTWNTTINGATTDAGVNWRNTGKPATASLAAAGGTGGIIIDNVVGTPAGASQIYFSTQSIQLCGSGGTGRCAVQASQSGLN
jgi:hypothetical protein